MLEAVDNLSRWAAAWFILERRGWGGLFNKMSATMECPRIAVGILTQGLEAVQT